MHNNIAPPPNTPPSKLFHFSPSHIPEYRCVWWGVDGGVNRVWWCFQRWCKETQVTRSMQRWRKLSATSRAPPSGCLPRRNCESQSVARYASLTATVNGAPPPPPAAQPTCWQKPYQQGRDIEWTSQCVCDWLVVLESDCVCEWLAGTFWQSVDGWLCVWKGEWLGEWLAGGFWQSVDGWLCV